MTEQRSITIPVFRIRQPIGELFVGRMTAPQITSVTYADVREMAANDLDKFMGINRRLGKHRVDELLRYVKTHDATFPTSIILAVREENAEFDEQNDVLTLKATKGVTLDRVGKIIDGQHRIAGLGAVSDGSAFEVCVTILVGADLATQANVFATVNLAQTKVNRSLAYDLLDYEKKRSPQKVAHNVAVALNRLHGSPFFRRIKRLGTATAGRKGETLTQAVVVEMLLNLMTDDPMADRDSLLRRIGLERPPVEQLQKRPFRGLFIQEKDAQIARILLRYFQAVRDRWPVSWDDIDRKGNTLPKTNGFRALIRFLKPAYLRIVGDDIGAIPEKSDFASILDAVDLADEDFNLRTFPPGTSGEAGLHRFLKKALEK